MFKLQDKILEKLLKPNKSCEKEFYSIRDRVTGIDDILTEMKVIDSKSSALLTHISIMFAVISFFLNSSSTQIFIKLTLGLEFIAYLLIIMALMKCIDLMGPPLRVLPNGDDNELRNIYNIEINLRRAIYQWSVRCVYFLTALLLPIIMAKYLVFGY